MQFIHYNHTINKGAFERSRTEKMKETMIDAENIDYLIKQLRKLEKNLRTGTVRIEMYTVKGILNFVMEVLNKNGEK